MTQHLEKAVALGSSMLTIVAPKFCCWSSAIVAMSSGVSYLAWVHPLRPYLWGISFITLGYSFYKAYQPDSACDSCTQRNKSFLQSKSFTWITGVIVLLVFIFSYFQ